MYYNYQFLIEEEAKQRICCGSFNHSQKMLCQGSKCMAWCWKIGDDQQLFFEHIGNPRTTKEPPRPDYIPPSWVWEGCSSKWGAKPGLNCPLPGWREPAKEAQSRARKGYCVFTSQKA